MYIKYTCNISSCIYNFETIIAMLEIEHNMMRQQNKGVCFTLSKKGLNIVIGICYEHSSLWTIHFSPFFCFILGTKTIYIKAKITTFCCCSIVLITPSYSCYSLSSLLTPWTEPGINNVWKRFVNFYTTLVYVGW